jgi:hypothetical protein
MQLRRPLALAAALFGTISPQAGSADPTAATLADRVMRTIYPDKEIPSGYGTPVSTELSGENPRRIQFSFSRSVDQVSSLVRFDLYDDEASLKKKYPAPWTKSGFDVELNPVVYRFGSYHASCSAHYSRAKAQVVDVCDMVLGATLMDVATTYDVVSDATNPAKPPSSAFLDRIRSTSTSFVTDAATFYIEVAGLSP